MPTPISYTISGAGGLASLPTTMLAQGLYLSAPLTGSRTDDSGTAAFTVAASAGWYRIHLAPGSGNDGTEEKPYELLAALATALGAARWAVVLTSTGHVKITYSGTGTGTVSWTGAEDLRDLLGFTGSLSIAAGASTTATYQPVGVLYAIARARCTGWRPRQAGGTAALAGSGRVTGRSDGRRILTQTWTSQLHPRTHAEAAEYGSYATPLLARDTEITRRMQPSGPVGAAAPWSVDEFCVTARGRRLAMALGTFQDIVSGGASRYEVGYLLPETLAGLEVPKSSGNWRAFHDLEGFSVSQVEGSGTDGTESR